MKTFKTETDAIAYARSHNVPGRKDMLVLVDGPEDDEITVMSLSEAIDNEFLYRWTV